MTTTTTLSARTRHALECLSHLHLLACDESRALFGVVWHHRYHDEHTHSDAGAAAERRELEALHASVSKATGTIGRAIMWRAPGANPDVDMAQAHTAASATARLVGGEVASRRWHAYPELHAQLTACVTALTACEALLAVARGKV